ncbi:MAG: 3-oxoadipate enol-lactonase [Pseudomonadota bacterium]
MRSALINGIQIHYRLDGPQDGPVLVFSNSLGTDLRVWDGLLSHLPPGYRILRYDTRGHGLSDAPHGEYDMADLVRDAGDLIAHLGLGPVVFVGLSIGGLIAQGLAAERPGLLRGAVFMDTAAKIGTEEMWAERIAAIRTGGIAALHDATMARWFSPAFRADPGKLTPWSHMLTRTPPQGYMGCARAIAMTDLYDSTARLRLPVLGIGGSEDGSTPPDLVRETTKLVPNGRFELIRGVGHLPCVEAPEQTARLIAHFVAGI